MFSVKPIIINDKKIYEVRIEVRSAKGGRTSRRRRYSTEREAKRSGLKLLTELKVKGDQYTWEEWSDKCVERMRLECRNSTVLNYKGILNKWINPHWQGRLLTEIKATDVHDLIFNKVSEVSQCTRRNVLKRVKRLLDMALVDGLIPLNPAIAIKVKVPQVHQKVLTASEIQTLLIEAKFIEHPFFEIWAFAILTGMRSGELYALKWSAINFEDGFIHVIDSWSNKNGFGSTKSARNRVVPISRECGKFLRDLRLRCQNEFVLPHLKEWKHGDQAKVLRNFCERLGITSIKFHDLRATFITQMLTRGVPLAQVMSIVGHSELKTTQGYLRLCGQDVKGATEALGVELPKVNQTENLFALKKGNG